MLFGEAASELDRAGCFLPRARMALQYIRADSRSCMHRRRATARFRVSPKETNCVHGDTIVQSHSVAPTAASNLHNSGLRHWAHSHPLMTYPTGDGFHTLSCLNQSGIHAVGRQSCKPCAAYGGRARRNPQLRVIRRRGLSRHRPHKCGSLSERFDLKRIDADRLAAAIRSQRVGLQASRRRIGETGARTFVKCLDARRFSRTLDKSTLFRSAQRSRSVGLRQKRGSSTINPRSPSRARIPRPRRKTRNN